MIIVWLWTAVWISGGVSALLNPELSAPATADAREAFIIQCNYNSLQSSNPGPQAPPGEINLAPAKQTNEVQEMLSENAQNRKRREAPATIHSLKLYAGAEEIFRYAPSSVPQCSEFPHARAHVERWRCAGGGCEVTVRARPGSIAWRCELSGEGPKFEILSSATAVVDVFAEPVYGPTIVGEPGGGGVTTGQMLLLNCSTDLAAPPADVTWLVDGLEVDEDSMSAVGVGAPDELGLRKSWRGARVAVPEGGADVRVECVATQPPPAPASAERRALLLLERTQQPQISKYTAASGASSSSAAALVPLWALMSLLLDRR